MKDFGRWFKDQAVKPEPVDSPQQISEAYMAAAQQPPALHGVNFPQALLDALGLPKYTKSFNLSCACNAIATVFGSAWNKDTGMLETFAYELTIAQLQGFTNAVQDHGITRRTP